MIRAIMNPCGRNENGKILFRVVLADGSHVELTKREIALMRRQSS